MELNELIRNKRREKNLTQQEFADMLFVSNKTVSKWETGRSAPDITLIARISELLGVSADQLLGTISSSKIIENNMIREKMKNVLLISSFTFLVSVILCLLGFARLADGAELFLLWFVFGGMVMLFAVGFYFVRENTLLINQGQKIKPELLRQRNRMLLIWYLLALSLPIGYVLLGNRDSYDFAEILIASAIMFVTISGLCAGTYLLGKR